MIKNRAVAPLYDFKNPECSMCAPKYAMKDITATINPTATRTIDTVGLMIGALMV